MIGTYNIGFGAYDKDFSFFMDTGRMIGSDKIIRGKYGKAVSREAALRNTEGAIEAARALKPDFMLFQEVDEKSHRARKVNQLAAIRDAFPTHCSVYAENFHTAYLFYPFNDPHGKTNAGIVTLADQAGGKEHKTFLSRFRGICKILRFGPLLFDYLFPRRKQSKAVGANQSAHVCLRRGRRD